MLCSIDMAVDGFHHPNHQEMFCQKLLDPAKRVFPHVGEGRLADCASRLRTPVGPDTQARFTHPHRAGNEHRGR